MCDRFTVCKNGADDGMVSAKMIAIFSMVGICFLERIFSALLVDGFSLVMARISAQDPAGGEEVGKDMTDQTGRYTIEQLLPGSYRAFAHYEAAVVQISNGQETGDVDFILAVRP